MPDAALTQAELCSCPVVLPWAVWVMEDTHSLRGLALTGAPLAWSQGIFQAVPEAAVLYPAT